MYFSEQGNVDDDATFITIFLVSFNVQSQCCLMQSAVCSLQSVVCSLQSAVCGLWSAVCSLQSANVIQRWNTKKIFSEQKTKKSFALRYLCPVHEVLSGILEPLIPGQIVNSFGQGKGTFDCQSGNFKNYSSGNHDSTRSCMLRIEKLINFNMTCMWTFHTNSLLHGYLFLIHVHK